MSITWSEIEEIIGKYEIGYSKSSILRALECITEVWGREFLDSVSRNTQWNIINLIDTGLMINELKGLRGSEALFEKLQRKERPAFSEARLATLRARVEDLLCIYQKDSRYEEFLNCQLSVEEYGSILRGRSCIRERGVC